MAFYFILLLILISALGLLFAPVWKKSLRNKQATKSLAFIAAIFALGSFGVYEIAGSPGIVPLMAEREARLAELKESILKNSKAVELDKKNLGAWVELGMDFMETGQFDAAANAFKQSVLISRGNPDLIMAYAKAMIFSEGGQVSDAAKKSLQMVILQKPDNAEARYYLIVRKLQDGKNEEAMREMKALYNSLPDDSKLKAMINRQIGRD